MIKADDSRATLQVDLMKKASEDVIDVVRRVSSLDDELSIHAIAFAAASGCLFVAAFDLFGEILPEMAKQGHDAPTITRLAQFAGIFMMSSTTICPRPKTQEGLVQRAIDWYRHSPDHDGSLDPLFKILLARAKEFDDEQAA